MPAARASCGSPNKWGTIFRWSGCQLLLVLLRLLAVAAAAPHFGCGPLRHHSVSVVGVVVRGVVVRGVVVRVFVLAVCVVLVVLVVICVLVVLVVLVGRVGLVVRVGGGVGGGEEGGGRSASAEFAW